jgi:hypothetical protein
MPDATQYPEGAALVGVFLDPEGQTADLWVIDRLTQKTTTRRIDTRDEPRNRIAEVLAVRAVDLLRASLLELLVNRARTATKKSEPKALPEEATRKASRWAEGALAKERSPTWGIEAGAAFVDSPGGIGPAVLSLARFRFAPLQSVQARLTLAGLGTEPRVTSTAGSASVQQRLLLGELVIMPWTTGRVTPLLTFGVGTLNVTVDGEASWPYRGEQHYLWAFATDAGLGLSLRLGPRLQVVVEGHALVAAPFPVVRFVNADIAQGALPQLLGTASLVGWL